MDIKLGFFYLFSGLLLFASFRVITAKNPVHAALFLVLAFFQAAGIWILLTAEFLAITLVLVYVGAVMVLFLFVVMMLDINIQIIRNGFWRHFPLAATIGVIIALEIIWVITGNIGKLEPNYSGNNLVDKAMKITESNNAKSLGYILYTDYLYPIQIAAVILLVAIIAAIALTLRGRKNKSQITSHNQIKVKAKDRIEIIKMENHL